MAAILQSAAQVLVRHGYEGTTTARVAERAGTSIGSVYQYFPNKEALIASLVDEHADEMLATVRVAIIDTRYPGLAEAMRAVVQAVASAHRANPALHKVLSEQVPHVGKHGLAMETHRMIAGYIEDLLRRHADEITAGTDITIAAVVIETVLEALIHKAVIDRSELLDGRVFEMEVLKLVSGYLKMPVVNVADVSDPPQRSTPSRSSAKETDMCLLPRGENTPR